MDHKTTFLDAHRHLRPTVETSRKCPIVRGALELKKAAKKIQDTQPMNDKLVFFVSQKRTVGPYVKSKDNRVHNSELKLHLKCAFDNLRFTHGTHYTFFLCICINKKYIHNIYIYIERERESERERDLSFVYIYVYICIYIYIYI